jgi:hypothetical protein
MKLQNFLLLVIFTSPLIFMSCRKESKLLGEKRIVKMTYDTIAVNYTYDNQQRLTKLEQVKNGNNTEATIIYDYSQTNQVIETPQSVYVPANSYDKIVYITDASNKVTKSNPRDAATNTDKVSLSKSYSYNADSQISETSEIYTALGHKTTMTNTYSGNNLTKSTYNSSLSGNITSSQENIYEYNPAIANTLDNERYGKSFLGKSSKNAYSKRTNTVTQNGVITDKTIENVTYEVNSEDYITKSKHVFNWTSNGRNGSSKVERSYFYQ